jgi:hypothetical protein
MTDYGKSDKYLPELKNFGTVSSNRTYGSGLSNCKIENTFQKS